MDAEFKTRAPQLKNRVVKVVKYYDPRTWKEKGLWWTAGLFLVTYLVIVIILSLVWSRSPGSFDVNEYAMARVGQDSTKLVPGTMTTAAAIGIAETLLNKPGGYLTNDITPPGIFLDNIPNWEFGALTELRDLSRALRNDFSRAQTQSVEDADLQIAEPKFNYDSQSWIFPSSESEYRDGIAALQRYMARLADDKGGDGEFFARADNLAAYLQVVAKRLGSLAQRLSYAVGQAPLDTALAGDASATEASPDARQTWNKTPWLKIDDVFFEARGYTWGLLRTLTAMEADFASVLEDKNALVSLKQIVRELENTQNTIWSPMILNGTGFGPMGNHSLVMASYISRANAAIIDLRRLLIEG
ncbi:DUF2333 family protein [Thiocapsa marina]|uniref:Uncharacterized conserved protein UCP029693 n=1 Tax=Thiocapsa marina 5811 TaxID=768671 RepID=F9U6G0_9GAMM|nr:DUF2333 family protein [Thiocapsa marina]EGV19836.1 Uncharacterized conserved protein UCP029693 [Thiocapsa marina 5811]